MLSRTADNLYWVSRYIERAEFLARILDATARLATAADGADGLAALVAACRARPSQRHQGAHAARPVGGEAAPARGAALKPDAERVAHHTSRDAELAVVVDCTRRLAPPRKPEGPARSIS